VIKLAGAFSSTAIAIVGRPETDTAADPTSFEPVAPFVAVEIGAVGEDRQPAAW